MALYNFIVSVVGLPLLVAGTWQLTKAARQWWRERRYRKPEWNEVIAARVTSYTDSDALRAAYGTFLTAPTADIVPSIVPAVYSNASGAATTIGSGLGMPIAPVRYTA